MTLAPQFHARDTQVATPQDRPITGRESEMSVNGAGGVSFEIDDWARLRRFLVLGTEGGTAYISEAQLTVENARTVVRCLKRDGRAVVREIETVSASGRAPRNDYALFALAMAASFGAAGKALRDLGDGQEALVRTQHPGYAAAVRKAALKALPRVARTGGHLLQFCGYVELFRGWGRGLRRAVARSWYSLRGRDDLAYQLLKYAQRGGWHQRDLLRLSHPDVRDLDDSQRAAMAWSLAQGAGQPLPDDPDLDHRMRAADQLRRIAPEDQPLDHATVTAAAELVRTHALPREVVPGHLLTAPETWDALLEAMPTTAMIRSLNRMTRVGLIAPGSAATEHVVARLNDGEALKKARVHPINLLTALRTYTKGAGARGGLDWTPVPAVSDALDRAFYLAFHGLPANPLRTKIGIDVSGSMSAPVLNGTLTCREAATALAMSLAATCRSCNAVGFTRASGGVGRAATNLTRAATGLTPIDVSPRRRLDDVVNETARMRFGGTDCALPILQALETGETVDTFVVITDNETWAGKIHPSEALRRYRAQTGIPARLVVVALHSTAHTIADPADAGMIDICGFDAALPRLVVDFAQGRV